MSIQTISPQRARELLDQGAMLVDIREPDEFAREHIANAQCIPAASMPAKLGPEDSSGRVIFHCRSGGRTANNAARLAGAANCEAYILEGGLDAWKKAGLPVERDASQPLELMRQVQIAAGGMVVLGVLLGAFVAPGFYLLSGFVGAGLLFAGVTGTCGLAMLLQRMPWNRRSA